MALLPPDFFADSPDTVGRGPLTLGESRALDERPAFYNSYLSESFRQIQKDYLNIRTTIMSGSYRRWSQPGAYFLSPDVLKVMKELGELREQRVPAILRKYVYASGSGTSRESYVSDVTDMRAILEHLNEVKAGLNSSLASQNRGFSNLSPVERARLLNFDPDLEFIDRVNSRYLGLNTIQPLDAIANYENQDAAAYGRANPSYVAKPKNLQEQFDNVYCEVHDAFRFSAVLAREGLEIVDRSSAARSLSDRDHRRFMELIHALDKIESEVQDKLWRVDEVNQALGFAFVSGFSWAREEEQSQIPKRVTLPIAKELGPWLTSVTPEFTLVNSTSGTNANASFTEFRLEKPKDQAQSELARMLDRIPKDSPGLIVERERGMFGGPIKRVSVLHGREEVDEPVYYSATATTSGLVFEQRRRRWDNQRMQTESDISFETFVVALDQNLGLFRDESRTQDGRSDRDLAAAYPWAQSRVVARAVHASPFESDRVVAAVIPKSLPVAVVAAVAPIGKPVFEIDLVANDVSPFSVGIAHMLPLRDLDYTLSYEALCQRIHDDPVKRSLVNMLCHTLKHSGQLALGYTNAQEKFEAGHLALLLKERFAEKGHRVTAHAECRTIVVTNDRDRRVALSGMFPNGSHVTYIERCMAVLPMSGGGDRPFETFSVDEQKKLRQFCKIAEERSLYFIYGSPDEKRYAAALAQIIEHELFRTSVLAKVFIEDVRETGKDCSQSQQFIDEQLRRTRGTAEMSDRLPISDLALPVVPHIAAPQYPFSHPVLETVSHIESLLDECIEQIQRQGNDAVGAFSSFSIQEMCERYLPDTLNAYLAVSPSDRTAALESKLLDQLQVMERSVQEELKALSQVPLTKFLFNGEFLKQRFPNELFAVNSGDTVAIKDGPQSQQFIDEQRRRTRGTAEMPDRLPISDLALPVVPHIAALQSPFSRPVLETVSHIESLLDECIEQIQRQGNDPVGAFSSFSIQEMRQRYLPDTLNAYLAVSSSDRTAALESKLLDQLQVMERSAQEELKALSQGPLRKSLANGEVLKQRFVNELGAANSGDTVAILNTHKDQVLLNR